jgi:diguanylate cyclase (GGDEF)-like protein
VSLLEDAGCVVSRAPDVASALLATGGSPVDLVITDLSAPGTDVLQALQLGQTLTSPPPVVLALAGDRVSAARLLEVEPGVVDFVAMPFDPVELRARVRAAIRMKRARDGLLVQATTDPLTGLANRRLLDLRAAALIAVCKRYGRVLSCLMLDLDGFKAINDRHGHTVGDSALRAVAATLRSVSRTSDVVGRYAGDEFVVLLPETDGPGAVAAAEKIRAALAALRVPLPEPLPAGEPASVMVRASIGVATWNATMTSPTALYAAADHALYGAKALGGNRVASQNPATAA